MLPALNLFTNSMRRPTTLYKLFPPAAVHLLIALLAQFILFASVGYYKTYPFNDNLEYLEGTRQAFEDNSVKNVESASMTVALILFTDLILDVINFVVNRDRGNKNSFSVEDFIDTAKDWAFRLTIIVVLIIPSSVDYFLDDGNLKAVFMMALMKVQNITGICAVMFVITDSSDKNRQEYLISYSMSGMFSAIALMLYFFNIRPQSPVGGSVTNMILCAFNCSIISYIYYRIYKVLRNLYLTLKATRRLSSMNLSRQEQTLLFNTVGLVVTTAGVALSMAMAGFEFRSWTAASRVVKDVSFLVYAVLSTLLSSRIARNEANKAMLVMECAERQVAQTLNSPLRLASKELETLLQIEQNKPQLDESRLKSLRRIALACHVTIEFLDKIPNLRTLDAATDLESNNEVSESMLSGMSNYSHRNLLSSNTVRRQQQQQQHPPPPQQHPDLPVGKVTEKHNIPSDVNDQQFKVAGAGEAVSEGADSDVDAVESVPDMQWLPSAYASSLSGPSTTGDLRGNIDFFMQHKLKQTDNRRNNYVERMIQMARGVTGTGVSMHLPTSNSDEHEDGHEEEVKDCCQTSEPSHSLMKSQCKSESTLNTPVLMGQDKVAVGVNDEEGDEDTTQAKQRTEGERLSMIEEESVIIAGGSVTTPVSSVTRVDETCKNTSSVSRIRSSDASDAATSADSDSFAIDFDELQQQHPQQQNQQQQQLAEHVYSPLQTAAFRSTPSILSTVTGTQESLQRIALPRGIGLYCTAEFEEACNELLRSIEIAEGVRLWNQSEGLVWPSELRLWLCASLMNLGKQEEASFILENSLQRVGERSIERGKDMSSNDVNVSEQLPSSLSTTSSSRSLSMSSTPSDRAVILQSIRFYAGRVDLLDVLRLISLETDDGIPDSNEGNKHIIDQSTAFFGYFYLGLYFDATGDVGMSKLFLNYARDCRNNGGSSASASGSATGASTGGGRKDIWDMIPNWLLLEQKD